MPRVDPATRLYKPAQNLDTLGSVLFYLTAILSFVAVLFDPSSDFGFLLVFLFVVFSIAFFCAGLAQKLYFFPRAEHGRRRDFLSVAYEVNLTHKTSDGYYNSGLSSPLERIAAQTFENAHFSKAITGRMAVCERWKIGLYAAIWLFCLVTRQTELAVVVAASQALFSEEIFSRWLRLEWLRIECEQTYERLNDLFLARPDNDVFAATSLEAFSRYEGAKMNASILLSSSIFHSMNDNLSAEWEEVKKKLLIDKRLDPKTGGQPL